MKKPCTDDEAAAEALKASSPKSYRPEIHKRMEGARKGLGHVTPVSLRFRNAHAAMGTAVKVPSEM